MSRADDEDGVDAATLAANRRDLFAAVSALGDDVISSNIEEGDELIQRFQRGELWREGLSAIWK